MPDCYAPRLAYQKNEGEKPIFIKNNDYEFYAKINDKSLKYKLLLVPCGHCPACVQNKALEWTSRLVKEAEEWKYTYFITLTYDDTHLRVPVYKKSTGELIRYREKSLNKRDIQLFLKRLRKFYDFDLELKYYICGEYGETTQRPHYHAIFFMNTKFNDLVFYANNLYTCSTLQKTWKQGNVLVSSDVNERSIKYTIGYTLKKIGDSKIQLMSKGLGLKYLNDKKEDIKFSNGFYLNNGFLVNPPSYFIRKMKESNLPEDIKWLEDYRNQPRGSIKITKTLDELLQDLLKIKDSKKGKGAF